MDWWLTQVGRVPIGPVSAELLLKGIRAGEVPNDVLVCEVGGTEWRKVTDVAPFGAAFAERRKARRFDPESERTVLDPQSFPPSAPPPEMATIPAPAAEVGAKGAAARHRTVRAAPMRADELSSVEDAEDDKTVVDAFPPLPSEPPQDAEPLGPWKPKRLA